MADAESSGKKRKRSDAKLLSSSEGNAKMSAAEKERLQRYSHGTGNKSKGVVKHRLKIGIKRSEKKINDASKRAAGAELLLPTEVNPYSGYSANIICLRLLRLLSLSLSLFFMRSMCLCCNATSGGRARGRARDGAHGADVAAASGAGGRPSDAA